MKSIINRYPKGLYRSRNGIILGVFTGIAEYLDLSVFWTRATALITLFATGFFPIAIIYIIAALIMKKRPYYSL
ncbi:MAG: PspC domain-containing protein [Deltaproteobacteria bacterium]|jgi:phage shock protein C|nr:PspC domain-containing protein [Deltaproteobacteria bacterium]MBT4526653.1 PspC domain-containing protein [Deltaproteobacteria bacterium]